MVWMTPGLGRKRKKLQLELAWLQLKEKLFGKISEKDERRRKEIVKELSIHY